MWRSGNCDLCSREKSVDINRPRNYRDDRITRKRVYNSYDQYAEDFKEKLGHDEEHNGRYKNEPSGMSRT